MRGPSDVRGIRLQQEGAAEVRGTQDRLRGERCLHLPKVLLPLGVQHTFFGCPSWSGLSRGQLGRRS